MATKNGAAGPSKRQSSAKRTAVSFCAAAAPESSTAARNAARRIGESPMVRCAKSTTPPRSFRLDAGCRHHLAQALDVAACYRFELRRRGRIRLGADRREALAHVGRAECLLQRIVQL